MALPTDKQMVDWAVGTEETRIDHRNWPVVRRLAAATVTLLLAGLPAKYVAGSPKLAAACWAGAAVTGTAMLVWFLDDRRLVEQPSVSRS